MSFFSSKPKNRRRRRAVSRDAWKRGEDTPDPKPKRRKRDQRGAPEEQFHQLHAQIGAIESFLARRDQAEEKRRQMKAENILPPPDRAAPKRSRTTMTLAERRRYLAERNRNGVRFLFLFVVACGLIWWLVFAEI